MHQNRDIVTLIRYREISARGDSKRRSVKISTAGGGSGLADLRLDEWSEWYVTIHYARSNHSDSSGSHRAYG
jgi:hypothetical protein